MEEANRSQVCLFLLTSGTQALHLEIFPCFSGHRVLPGAPAVCCILLDSGRTWMIGSWLQEAPFSVHVEACCLGRCVWVGRRAGVQEERPDPVGTRSDWSFRPHSSSFLSALWRVVKTTSLLSEAQVNH